MWSKLLVYRLLIDVVGDEILVKKHYPLPTVHSSDKLRHYTGILGKHGATLTVADEEGCRQVCMDKQTIIEGNCTNVKAVHVFTEKQMSGKEPAAAIIGPELYEMVAMIAGNGEKMKALREYISLREDRKKTVKAFMLNDNFRTAIIHFLGFLASYRMEKQHYHIGSFEMLTLHFNSCYASKLGLMPVDFYRAEAILDMMGDEIHLSENSVIPYISWPSVFSAFSISRGCSIWGEMYNTPAQILLSLKENICIPMHWYVVLLSETGISELIADIMKHSCRGEKKVKGDQLLLQVLWSVEHLPKKDLEKVLERLFQKTVPEHLLTTLKYLPENPAWETCCKYIERVHGKEYAQTVQTIVTMERERINRSLGIGG